MSRKTEAKQQAILEMATEVFREFGFERASIAEICARLGSSKRTIYNYFASKEELFFAVITRSAAHEFKDIHDFIDPSLTDMAESLRNFGEKLLAFLYSPQMIEQRHLSISASRRTELGRLAYEEGVLRSLRLTAESLQAAMDAGKLRQADAFVATQQLFALLEAELLKASLLQQLGEVSPERIRELTARAVAVFMAAYGPETQT